MISKALKGSLSVSGGELTISGHRVTDLANRFGTPLYVYDLAVVERKYRMIKEALPRLDVFYSIKANPNMHIIKRLHSLGAGAEIASAGELFLARKAGIAPKDIIFAGPGKTDKELRESVITGIHAVNVESLGELMRLESIADELGKDIGVELRINTQRTVSDAPEKMVGGPSKFGFDEESVLETVRSVELRRCKILGIHVYTASGVLKSSELVANFERTLDLACDLSQQMGFALKSIDFGGGLGVPYSADEPELDLEDYSSQISRLLDERSESFDLSSTRLILELGRYLVAECGIFLVRVIDIKESRGRRYLIVDGGMNHQIRPAFMKLNHPTVVANRMEGLRETVSVGGPLCTPIDMLANDVEVGKAQVGDIVAVINSGAYGYTMSMLHFLSHPLPAEVVIDSGTPIIARRRGGTEDALIYQVNY